MIRYFIIFLFLKSFLFGCALCSVYTPKTYIYTDIKANNENIETINIKWKFEKEFTDELLQIYDLNLDKTFDSKELKLIEDSLIDYLASKDFITKIYYDNDTKEKKLNFVVKDYKMSFKKGILGFEYNISLNQRIYDKSSLRIAVFDKDGYFFTIFEAKNQTFETLYKFKKSIKINEVSYTFDDINLSQKQEIKKENLSDELKQEKKENIEPTIVKVDEKPKGLLDKFIENIKKSLVDIENGDKFALIFLLMASFLYGVVHALGPGHGKALAFSYFSSQKSTYFEAFIISLLSAFVHIIGALFIVIFSVFILQSVLNNFLENSVSYITATSAIIIMFLALYILYRKINKKSCSCVSCSVELKTTKFDLKPQNQNISFVKTSQNKPIVVKKRSKKQDLIFVLTAGIVPCPGTVLLFVYAFLLKTYFAVIMASISISLGMAIVIFASSFLGVSLHKLSSKSKNIVNILEIVAPIFMFILALLLLLSSIKL